MLFGIDVGPDVELGPVAEREDAHALAGREAGVEDAPELGPLVLGVPGVLGVAVGEDALLGARLLLVAAGAADRGVVLAGVERLAQRLRLHDVGVARRAVVERVDAVAPAPRGWCGREARNRARAAIRSRKAIISLELPRGVDVEQRERDAAREEGLAREMQQDRGVLADRVHHHRPLEARGDLAEDLDALGFKSLEMRERAGRLRHGYRCPGSVSAGRRYDVPRRPGKQRKSRRKVNDCGVFRRIGLRVGRRFCARRGMRMACGGVGTAAEIYSSGRRQTLAERGVSPGPCPCEGRG